MNLKPLGPSLFFCLYTLFGNSAASFAATLDLPGFNVVRQYSLPAGVPENLGDIRFSEDGDTLYILGGSESAASAVWTAPVIRDGSGIVTGFGAATELFALEWMDTSLEVKPGTDTLFFSMLDAGGAENPPGRVGQRLPDGTIRIFEATETEVFFGLAFVPDSLPNAGDLLTGSWDTGVINSHFLTDNGDGTFTPVLQGFYSNSAVGATGDLHFIPSGEFAGDLMWGLSP